MATYVVSGANRGIGFEFCRQLLARGDRVVAGCRKPGRAAELNRLAFEHPGHLHVLPLDVSKPESIQSFANELGLVIERVDALVNNAAILESGERLGALDPKPLLAAFTTNALGPLLLTQALLPMLERGKAARVLMLTSDLGSLSLTGKFGTPGYAISKAALNMVTRQLAPELAARDIVCVAANPGWVRTEMGGARAPLSVTESVASLLAWLDGVGPAQAGGVFERDGAVLPW